MEEMVGYTMSLGNKAPLHGQKGYALPVAYARSDEREVLNAPKGTVTRDDRCHLEAGHGTGDRELCASVASKVQQALALYEALAEGAKQRAQGALVASRRAPWLQ